MFARYVQGPGFDSQYFIKWAQGSPPSTQEVEAGGSVQGHLVHIGSLRPGESGICEFGEPVKRHTGVTWLSLGSLLSMLPTQLKIKFHQVY